MCSSWDSVRPPWPTRSNASIIGDEVTCYCEIIKVGTTSITVKVESWARRGTSEEQIEVTEGIFTYVAIDDNRRPRPVPARKLTYLVGPVGGCRPRVSGDPVTSGHRMWHDRATALPHGQGLLGPR